ncbi:MAG: GntR family transcriptional regulator, partial [Desulfobacterales bacterium]|nr:GntR family transcriptional regulator [Desulfobacterales bacterium]
MLVYPLTTDLRPNKLHKVTTFKPIRKRLLSKEVEQQLRQAIVSGVYRPGDRLPS